MTHKKEAECCDGEYFAKNMCRAHYNREYRKRTTPGAYPSVEERFMKFVDKTDDCWLWKGTINRKGYGQFKINYRYYVAHRVSFELAGGVIGDGLQVDHLCYVRHCVNPDHLEAVTPSENMRRAYLHKRGKLDIK